MHNPFVKKFRQLSQSPNLHQCKLLIKEQHLNQPQYCLPSASQMAAIIVGGEEAGHLSGREILVQTFGGNLIYVQDTAGYYDPLQYPILFLFGTYGWDINTRDANRNKVSCRDYYAYIFQVTVLLFSKILTSKCHLHYKMTEPTSIFTNVQGSRRFSINDLVWKTPFTTVCCR